MLSLEAWDGVWRRNQHLAARLVQDGLVGSLVFATPPAGGLTVRARPESPYPESRSSRRRSCCRGGTAVPGARPVAAPSARRRRCVVGQRSGRRCRGAAIGVLADDVTDDWREMVQAPADRRRLVAAEDALAGVARTVVCSEVLAQRWMTRYGVEAIVIQNGVDVAAIGAATPRRLAGSPPHAVYVGTVHTNRIDVDLVAELADRFPGTVHLVGPDYLDAGARGRLRARGVLLDGPAPASEVPSWLVSADVLICPHVVDGFTLSLDAIKSHEYLATDRPVVATPSSGFQSLVHRGWRSSTEPNSLERWALRSRVALTNGTSRRIGQPEQANSPPCCCGSWGVRELGWTAPSRRDGRIDSGHRIGESRVELRHTQRFGRSQGFPPTGSGLAVPLGHGRMIWVDLVRGVVILVVCFDHAV